jgi:hypothetical protein
MEVPMLNTKRRVPQFDCLEGKILLSTGMAEPAATDHRDAVKRFVLNGSLSGLPNGSPGIEGYTETSFPVTGRLASMGKVSGSFALEDAFIPTGKKPDLSGASLSLENSKGSIQLNIAQSTKHQYKFTIVSGTESYVSVSGSGTMIVSSPRSTLDLVIKLNSTAVKKL